MRLSNIQQVSSGRQHGTTARKLLLNIEKRVAALGEEVLVEQQTLWALTEQAQQEHEQIRRAVSSALSSPELPDKGSMLAWILSSLSRRNRSLRTSACHV